VSRPLACLPVAALLVGAIPAHAAAGNGYRANLTACITASRSCDRTRLSRSDRDFLRHEPTARTRDRALAGEIADARLSPPVRIDVSERRLDRMHARDVRFETYRSTVRALRHGWIPGENEPYRQPPEGWADAYENWGGR
jgi:hypothetical protein